MAKTKSEKKPRTKRPRQSVIPGTEPMFDQGLDDAGNEYVEARDERMALTRRETETQASLKILMIDRGLVKYVTAEGLVATHVHSEADKVSVKVPKAGLDVNGDGEE